MSSNGHGAASRRTKSTFWEQCAERWVERVMGIEPTLAAWEAAVLPLNYTRIVAKILGCHRRVGKYISLHFSTALRCRRPQPVTLYCEKSSSCRSRIHRARPILLLAQDGGGVRSERGCRWGKFDAAGNLIGFALQAAEKSYATFSITAHNRGGHSSKPRPDNAIYDLAAALMNLSSYRFEPQLNEITRAYFSARQAHEPGALGNAMRSWLANEADGAAADAIEADANETGMTRTRCVATRIQGGHADNTLPQQASATVNCRIMPGVSVDQVRQQLVKLVGNAALEIRTTAAATPGPASPLRKDVLEAYTAAVQRRFPHAPIIPEMSTVGTESRQFRSVGIPSYGVDGQWIVVPQDQRMHGQDERLPVQALFDDVGIFPDMIARLAGQPAASH
jgi:hypothetical protein